jgi:hypothetical protein
LQYVSFAFSISQQPSPDHAKHSRASRVYSRASRAHHYRSIFAFFAIFVFSALKEQFSCFQYDSFTFSSSQQPLPAHAKRSRAPRVYSHASRAPHYRRIFALSRFYHFFMFKLHFSHST